MMPPRSRLLPIKILALLLSIGPASSALLGADAAPATAAEPLVADGGALLREWHPPVYPPAALKGKRSGMVNVRLIVDEAGKVAAARALEDSDNEFVDTAIAAVKTWVFAPAIDRGRPIASCVDTLVTFSPAQGQQRESTNHMPPSSQTFTAAPRTSPKPLVTPEGEYPDVLVTRKLPGVVRFVCIVSPEGRLIQPRVVGATHADFVQPAIDALHRWEFSPGMWGDLAITAPVEGQMTFDSIGGRIEDVYVANGLSAPDGSPAPITPEPLTVVDPVWPLDRLLAGESGAATVEFNITRSGRVKDVRVKEASQAEFGEALVAAVTAWSFDRPIGNKDGAPLVLAKRAEFVAVPLDAAAGSDPLARVVVAMRADQLAGAKGLDEKVTPLYRVAPLYPEKLLGGERPSGRAEIEFVIDQDGRARLPRIVTESHPEFGWAAATAVSQWIFKAPRRAGEPVNVRVKIPFDFVPPAT